MTEVVDPRSYQEIVMGRRLKPRQAGGGKYHWKWGRQHTPNCDRDLLAEEIPSGSLLRFNRKAFCKKCFAAEPKAVRYYSNCYLIPELGGTVIADDDIMNIDYFEGDK